MTAETDHVKEQYNRLTDELAATSELKDFANWRWFTTAEWEALCSATAAFIDVRDGDRLFEAGCGSGAFLAALATLRSGLTLAGADIADKLVAIARARVPGNFHVGDITDLREVPPGAYDKVLSHGVVHHLPSLADVERAALEMIRIARPGGLIYVGVVNDPDRRAALASYEHPPSGLFLITRSFWRELAARHGLTLSIVDQDTLFTKPNGYDAYSRARYSLVMRKP